MDGCYTPEQALAALGDVPEQYVSLLRQGVLEAEIYRPVGADPQQPHTRDEIYVVISGRGVFERGSERLAFAPGDLLFVSAGVPHRFVDFSDDFATWVIFGGA